jgi:hypothetical protein
MGFRSSFDRRFGMHPAAVLEVLVDGTVKVSSRATTFPLVAAPDSTVVILALCQLVP